MIRKNRETIGALEAEIGGKKPASNAWEIGLNKSLLLGLVSFAIGYIIF